MISSGEVLAVVKRAVSVPASQPLLTDADILALADMVISSRLVPLIESFDTDFFVRRDNVPLVGGQAFYDIPYRAVGRGLRDILINDSLLNARNLPLIALEEENFFLLSTNVTGFNFHGDQIHLIPAPQNNVTDLSLTVIWRMPPSKLMIESDAGVVASVQYNVAGLDEVTLNGIPTFLTTGTQVDFVQRRSGSSILEFDRTVQSISGNTVRFTTGQVPTSLSAGDYVCPQGYSPVVNSLPNECIGLLSSHVSYKVLQAIGDYDAANQIKKQDIPDEEKDFKSLMSPRIDGEPVIVINRRSLVRGNKFAQRRWIGPP